MITSMTRNTIKCTEYMKHLAQFKIKYTFKSFINTFEVNQSINQSEIFNLARTAIAISQSTTT